MEQVQDRTDTKQDHAQGSICLDCACFDTVVFYRKGGDRMREIKFRGLNSNSNNSKMIYGNYHSVVGLTNIGDRELNLDLHYILQKRLPTDIGWYLNDSYIDNQVVKETVGQFTGLKDKNGKEIYEGDICKTSSFDYGDEVQSVVFEEGCFSFSYHLWSINKWEQRHIEIIGNIHQNPELI